MVRLFIVYGLDALNSSKPKGTCGGEEVIGRWGMCVFGEEEEFLKDKEILQNYQYTFHQFQDFCTPNSSIFFQSWGQFSHSPVSSVFHPKPGKQPSAVHMPTIWKDLEIRAVLRAQKWIKPGVLFQLCRHRQQWYSWQVTQPRCNSLPFFL